jgi:hypothetical protein
LELPNLINNTNTVQFTNKEKILKISSANSNEIQLKIELST